MLFCLRAPLAKPLKQIKVVCGHQQFSGNGPTITLLGHYPKEGTNTNGTTLLCVVFSLVVFLFSKTFEAILPCFLYNWKSSHKGDYMNLRADTDLHQAIVWGEFIKLVEKVIGRELGRETMRGGTYGFLPIVTHSNSPDNLAMGAISLRQVAYGSFVMVSIVLHIDDNIADCSRFNSSIIPTCILIYECPSMDICGSKCGNQIIVSVAGKSLAIWDVMSSKLASKVVLQQFLSHDSFHSSSSKCSWDAKCKYRSRRICLQP